MYQSHINRSLTRGLSGESFPSYHGGLEATSNSLFQYEMSLNGGCISTMK